MRLILDANALIYIIKANISTEFYRLSDFPIVLDKSVYNEVVEKGIENNYPDAHIVKDFLEKKQIPIIPIDISGEISKFRDPGETSCYLLAKSEGLCISSDSRANRIFNNMQVPFMQLDTFFYNQYLKNKITEMDFVDILEKLKKVDGTSANRINVFLELISKGGK